MAGIRWWTSDRLSWLRAQAALGLTAREIASQANRRWDRAPPLTWRGITQAASIYGIKLLAKGGGRRPS